MIYLAKPTGEILGRPNGLREETCKVKKTLTDMWELSFDVNKYTDENDDFSSSDFYESLSENMYLLLESDTANALFLIDTKPVVTNDGIQETKSITAHTAECELQQKFLRSFYINNGTGESQEYLADDNIDPYTGLPKEYIRLVNFEKPGLSLLHLALQETGWTVDDSLQTAEAEACAGKYQFSVDGKDVYSFLMSEVAQTAKILFFFDRRKRRVSFRSYPHIGKDTGICIGLRNLASRIQIESTADAALITAYRPACDGGLGIEYVNFGDPCLYNLDYFADTHDAYGDYQYVTESFHDQYAAWKKKREELRPDYIALTESYNKTLLDVSELQNRLPNDGCSIDYKTYKADELAFSLNAYEKALAALITLYKKEYPALYADPGVKLDESHLRTTMYWHDYYAYKYQIIPAVVEAMKIWYATDQNGNLLRDENGNYVVCENGNPAYAGNPAIVKPVNAFLYEFELYGLTELKAKKKAWMECVNLLYRDGFITSGTKENPKAYLTPDETGWGRLTAGQKAQFTTIAAFKDTLNSYLDYMAFASRPNAITGTTCKGIVRLCEDAISKRQGEIDSLQKRLASVGAERDALSSSVLPENNFSAENLKLFCLLVREADYSSKNIVTTNLDDVLTMIGTAEELYQDAETHLKTASRPQYAFHTTIDNLFALEEFAPLREDFAIGNFIRLLPDLFRDDSVKLRLISIESNPLLDTGDISVEFSTMTRSLSDINDLAFLFGEGASGTSRSSGSSSGGGTYGKNDAEIQIANNMLNALLKSETFGTQVSDVILDSIRANKGNFGKLLSHSGIFDSLESGEIKVNGTCLTNIIQSLNYIAGSEGSMFNLENGSVDFAGGALTYTKNKGLVIKGAKGKTSIDGSSVNTGAITSNNYNGTSGNPLGNTKGSIIDLTNGQFSLGGGKIKWNGSDLAIDGGGTFAGDVIATTLTATQSGNIAGWNFNQNGFYKSNSSIASKNGMYIGEEGISIKDSFVAKSNGLYIKSEDWISDAYLNYIGDDYTTLCNIMKGQWIRIYMYNTADIDYFNMSWKYNLIVEMVDDDDGVGGAAAIIGIASQYIIRGYGVSGRTEAADAMSFDGENVLYLDVSYDNLYDPNAVLNNKDVQEYLNIGLKAKVSNVIIEKIYSNGRSIGGRYFNGVQIGKVEIYNSDNTLRQTIHGTRTNDRKGMMINTYSKHIYAEKFSIDNDSLSHSAVYQSISSTSPNVYIDSNGSFKRSSSSSQRYKTDITTEIPEDLSPEKLYDLDIVSFKYKDHYLSPQDCRYQSDIVGLIAEDVFRKYPLACNFDANGNPEMWEIHILFPAALKLIQEQHEEIEKLKQRVTILEQKA